MITAIEIGLAAVATVVMFLCVLVQAGQRYLPFEGWTWTGELARFCLVWLTFVMAGVLVTSEGHISLEVIDLVENPLVVRVVRVFASVVVALVGVGFAVEAWDQLVSQGPLKSPALRLPMAWFYVLPLIGFVSTAIRATAAAVRFAVHGVPARPAHAVVAGE
ncbi:TRAP transporter small permease [Blastococcus litoris]|uniref:TRAP transporter small permease n=1 Tax=Blastococcus litoris TaxID=2171622 RepID=UPI0013DF2A88|nr:TRAP transporter small permease subunit [Blastococcus litoris]